MKLSSSSLASLAVLLLVIQGSPQQVQEATVRVTEKVYEQAELKIRLGVPARLTFVRETDATFGT